MEFEKPNPKQERRKLSPIKIIFGLGVLFSLMGALLLVLIEVSLRITESEEGRNLRIFYQRYYSEFPEELLTFDAELGWKSAPNSILYHEKNGWSGRFFIDKHGFRMPLLNQHPTLSPNKKHEKRLMLIGDSYGFGMGAHDDETISFFLNKKTVPEVELRNISSPGWSPEQYLVAYEKYKGEFKPTHIYMLITHINDFFIMENCTAFNRLKPTVQLRNGQNPRLLNLWEMRAFKPSYDSPIWDFRLLYTLGKILEPLYLRNICGVDKPYGMLADYEQDRLELYSRSQNRAGKYDPIWKRFDYIVERMQEKVRDEGSKLTIIILYLGDLNLSSTHGEDYSVDVVVDKVKTIGARHGIDVLYPHEKFKEVEAKGLRVSSPQGHYGPLGNEIIADVIVEHGKFNHSEH